MNPDLRSRLEAFGRDCVFHGDMTPMAERMLKRILDEHPDDEVRWPMDVDPGTPIEVVAEAMRQMWNRDSAGIGIVLRARQIVGALERAGYL
jgi:hypothetical protein